MSPSGFTPRSGTPSLPKAALLLLSTSALFTSTNASPIQFLGGDAPPPSPLPSNGLPPLSPLPSSPAHHSTPGAGGGGGGLIKPLGDALLGNPSIHFLQDAFIGNNFLDGFYFHNFDDPTHGRVNYVDQGIAAANNLTYSNSDTFVMRADYEKVVQPGDRGRDSVRIASKKLYNDGVIILDLAHMPEGCGTWPAFWTVTRGAWPAGGEIDIIEGVNDKGPNLSSLHTTPYCDMPAQRTMGGTAVSNQCDATLNSNQGCGVTFNDKPTSFGPAFNQAGGGWYVLRRSPTAISTWFFPRSSPNVPLDILSGSPTLDESLWGPPDAEFPTGQGCTLEGAGGVMGDHEIIFDLTFCGDWAGNTYGSSGCPSNCVDFVDNNPSAFENAFWQINSMRTYN